MKYIPIPSKWKEYNVKAYLSNPIQLQYIHIALMIITLIVFTLFMIYFTSLKYDEFVEIGEIKHSEFDSEYDCKSIGSRSSDCFDFVSHSASSNDTNYINYTFINYNAVYNHTFPYVPGPLFSSWNTAPGYYGRPYPLELSTHDGSMNYSVDKGHAKNPETCKNNLFQQLCNVTNVNNTKYSNDAIKVHFWYEIITVFNVSIYYERLKWYYHSTKDIDNWDCTHFSLYYLKETTNSIGYSSEMYNYWDIPNIPDLYAKYNCTFQFPEQLHIDADYKWYFSLTNGDSISSVWDFCKSRFVADIENWSVYIGWKMDNFYNNKTVFKIDPKIKGMLECWYYDPIHGLIKTDYYNSYGQNDIIPTPSQIGILLDIENNLFDYSNTLTKISDGDRTYVRIDDENVVTTNDALNVWQNNICYSLISGYCNWIDVPPYFCKKNIHKTIIESISLSLSPTSTAYSILLLSFLLIIKCKSLTSNAITFSSAKEMVDMSSVNLILK